MKKWFTLQYGDSGGKINQLRGEKNVFAVVQTLVECNTVCVETSFVQIAPYSPMGFGKSDCRKKLRVGKMLVGYLYGTLGFPGFDIVEGEWEDYHIGIFFFDFTVEQFYGIEF